MFPSRLISGRPRLRCPSCDAALDESKPEISDDNRETQPEERSTSGFGTTSLANLLSVVGVFVVFVSSLAFSATVYQFILAKSSVQLIVVANQAIGAVVCIGIGGAIIAVARKLRHGWERCVNDDQGRPLSITIISVYLAFSSLYGLWIAFLMWSDRRTFGAVTASLDEWMVGYSCVSVCLLLCASFLIYHGVAIGRWIYLVLCIVGIPLTASFLPSWILSVGIAVNLVIFFFLFRPRATKFFTKDRKAPVA